MILDDVDENVGRIRTPHVVGMIPRSPSPCPRGSSTPHVVGMIPVQPNSIILNVWYSPRSGDDPGLDVMGQRILEYSPRSGDDPTGDSVARLRPRYSPRSGDDPPSPVRP